MNHIKASILELQSVDSISIVKFKTGAYELKMMALELDENLEEGKEVLLGVKASNIALAKDIQTQLSISNQLPCKIESINRGELLCSVKLRFMEFLLESIITVVSCSSMQLKEGDEVMALVKSSELSIVEVL